MSPKPLTNPKTPNPSNPSSLPSRFEIRRLEPKDIPIACALVAHSNAFHSTIWPHLYPDAPLGQRALDIARTAEYLCTHQVNSGMSFGVFDTSYAFHSADAARTGGHVSWPRSGPDAHSVEATTGRAAEGERLLRLIDSPLVSVALSYDASQPLDHDAMEPLVQCLPHFGLVYHILEEKDQRAPEDWVATGPKQVLLRNATSTRRDYEGLGLMSGLARWLQREAALEGYRGIQIECLSDAVTHVWSEGADERFKGRVVSEFNCEDWRDEEGKLAFEPVKQRVTKCYVDLRGGATP